MSISYEDEHQISTSWNCAKATSVSLIYEVAMMDVLLLLRFPILLFDMPGTLLMKMIIF